jgi:hypothetical protein
MWNVAHQKTKYKEQTEGVRGFPPAPPAALGGADFMNVNLFESFLLYLSFIFNISSTFDFRISLTYLFNIQ